MRCTTGIVGCRQALDRVGALALVAFEVSLERVGREIRGEAQARDLVDLRALLARQRLARGEQIVGNGRVQVVERVARLDRHVLVCTLVRLPAVFLL